MLKKYRTIKKYFYDEDSDQWDILDNRHKMIYDKPYEVISDTSEEAMFSGYVTLFNHHRNRQAYFASEVLSEEFTKEERPELFL